MKKLAAVYLAIMFVFGISGYAKDTAYPLTFSSSTVVSGGRTVHPVLCSAMTAHYGSHGGVQSYGLGYAGLEKEDVLHTDFPSLTRNGEHKRICGYGVLSIDEDCPDALVLAVVQEIRVKGKVRCSPALRAHYKLK